MTSNAIRVPLAILSALEKLNPDLAAAIKTNAGVMRFASMSSNEGGVQ
jgi:hypothetical protein